LRRRDVYTGNAPTPIPFGGEYKLINVTWEENVKRKRKKEENMNEGGKTKDKWEMKLKG
jgi:hypothetical protein